MTNIRVTEQRIFFVRVEQGEVLHDNSDEKIQNDIGDDDVERTEVKNRSSRVAAITFPIGSTTRTSRRNDHTVVHNFIPVFTCDDAHQKNNRTRHCFEVGMSKMRIADRFFQLDRCVVDVPAEFRTEFDASEENHSSKGVDQHQ